METNPYEHAAQSLKRLLTHDKFKYSLQVLQQSHPTSQNDRGFWYSKSYPVILHRFKETRAFNNSEEAWIERAALVFAWVARIPALRLDRKSMFQLADLENVFHASKLWEVGTESYLGGLNDPIIGIHHGERIFGAAFGIPPVLIKQFVQLANAIINYGDQRLNFATTTKMLHFMLPELFPIFDKQICKAVFGSDRIEDYYKYHAYIFALQDYLNDEAAAEPLFQYARQYNLSPLRIVDLIVLQDGLNINGREQ